MMKSEIKAYDVTWTSRRCAASTALCSSSLGQLPSHALYSFTYTAYPPLDFAVYVHVTRFIAVEFLPTS